MTRQRSLGLGVDLAEDERNGGLAAGQPIPRSIPETG
jgi:hypothetical protein